MSSNGQPRLDDLYKMVAYIYSHQNDQRSPATTFAHFAEVCGMLTIHDQPKRREEYTVIDALCKALGWYFPLLAKLSSAAGKSPGRYLVEFGNAQRVKECLYPVVYITADRENSARLLFAEKQNVKLADELQPLGQERQTSTLKAARGAMICLHD